MEQRFGDPPIRTYGNRAQSQNLGKVSSSQATSISARAFSRTPGQFISLGGSHYQFGRAMTPDNQRHDSYAMMHVITFIATYIRQILTRGHGRGTNCGELTISEPPYRPTTLGLDSWGLKLRMCLSRVLRPGVCNFYFRSSASLRGHRCPLSERNCTRAQQTTRD